MDMPETELVTTLRARGRPPKPILPGTIFGKLVVLADAPPIRQAHSLVSRSVCVCECGEEVIVRNNSLRSGKTKSCGCSAGRSNNFKGMTMGLPNYLSREFIQSVLDIVDTLHAQPEGFTIEFESPSRAMTFQSAVYRIRRMKLDKDPNDESLITKVGLSRKDSVVSVYPMKAIFATAKVRSFAGKDLAIIRRPSTEAAALRAGLPESKLTPREQYDELFVTIAEHILGDKFSDPVCEHIARALLARGWDYNKHAARNPGYTIECYERYSTDERKKL